MLNSSFVKSLLIVAFTATLGITEDKPEAPRIAFASPLAVPANATTKIILRGWKLQGEIQAKSSVPNISLKVLKQEKVGIPGGQDAKQVGDSIVEVEVTVPAEFTAESFPVTLAAGAMESAPYSVLVGGQFPVIAEVEPNDGFRQAQTIAVPQIVDGQIHADRNVDVFAVELASSQRLIVEVIARRQGSGLDSLLTIFDAKGRRVALNDDAEGADSKIEMRFEPGRYFIVVQDAHDHGGPTHPYRLVVRN